MKKEKDPGLDYLQQLGIRALRNTNVIFDNMDRLFGKEQGQRFSKLIDKRAQRESFTDRVDWKEADKTFYDAKNEKYDLSLYLTGAFDGDIVRKACNWIVEHRDFFGKTILEIGCDIGLISCFLAKTVPDSTIIAIDRCKNGLAIGQKLAEKFELTNVKFIRADANELTDQYDTVFSMRVMHENHRSVEDTTLLFKQSAHMFQEGTNTYAQTLSRLVTENGFVISIERCGKNPLYLGWLWALRNNGLIFDPELYSELKCQEVGKESTFEASVCVKDLNSDISEDELYNVFCATFIGEFNPSSAQFDGWVAAVMLQNSFNNLIEGYEAYAPNENNWKFLHLSLWTNSRDASSLLAYDVKLDEGLRRLYNADISKKDGWIERNREFCRQLIKNGYIVKKVEYEDGKIISGATLHHSSDF